MPQPLRLIIMLDVRLPGGRQRQGDLRVVLLETPRIPLLRCEEDYHSATWDTT